MRSPTTIPTRQAWSFSDGYQAQGRFWPATTDQPPYAYLYLHGIQSHGRWFEGSASLLAQGGCPVILADRRGSGLNTEQRGDTPSIERWLLDLDDLADWAEGRFGISRFALVGVSWGGKLALAWAQRNSQRVCRALLIAPGVFPAVDCSFLSRMRIAGSLVTGGKRRFEIPLSDPALFTDNPAGQTFIRDDPLKLTAATARFLYGSRRLDSGLRHSAANSLAAPTTLLTAGDDRIIRNEPTRAWLERVCVSPPIIEELPGAHTLEFAADPRRFDEFLTWWRDS